MVDNINSLTIILIIIIGIMMFLVVILGMIYILGKMKKNKKAEQQILDTQETADKKTKVIPKDYSVDNIFDFMEFDKIEDNMISQMNGEKYSMVVECQGINYDLMSEPEKVSVEEGFIQFLNTLTHPVQIYTQTRTINLENSIQTYREKVKEIESNLEKQKVNYEDMQKKGTYTKEQMQKAYFELTKQTNLVEYGKDVIYNTEKMSLNKNVLNKKYYIIIPYYTSELGANNFDKEEMKNLAFSELYTRAQSVIRTLAACEVGGRVLTSIELVDLLYVAYNRDDAEVFGIEKAIAAGMEDLYSTAPDVLDKKMKLLNQEIEKKAIEKANKKIAEAKSEKQQRIEEAKENMNESVSALAKAILQENALLIGEDIAQSAVEKIEQEEKQEKGGTKENVGQEKKTRKRRTTKQTK